MRNKKFLKAIATITIGAVASVGMFTIAACSSCDDEHTHNYGDGWEKNADGHYQICLDCDEPSETAPHSYTDDNDTTCDVCGYVREIGGGTENPDATALTKPVLTLTENVVSWTADSHASGYKYSTDNGTTWNDVTGTSITLQDSATVVVKAIGDGTTYSDSPVSDPVTYTKQGGGEDTKTLYDELVAKSNKIYNNDFATDGAVAQHDGWGTAGFYGQTGDNVAIANGAASHVAGKGNTNIVVDFGVLAADSTVEGYMELNCSAMGSKWNLVRFVGASGVVFDLRTPASGSNFVYSLDGGTTEVAAEEAVATAKDTVYKVYYKIDLSTGKITLTVNEKKIVTELEANITEVKGIYIPSSSSGSRLVTVDNLVFCGTAVSLADYQADLAGKLDAKAAAMTAEDGTHTSETAKAKVATALAEGKAAVNAAETHKAALAAYNAAVNALNLIPGSAYEDVVAYVHTKYDPADYTNPASKTKYDQQIKAILDETDMAKLALPAGDDLETAGEKLKAVLTALAEVETDEDVWTNYLEAKQEELLTSIDITDYRINVLAAQNVANTAFEKIKQYSEYESYQAAVDAVDAMVSEITTGFAEIETDDEVLAKDAQELIEMFNEEVDAIIAELENPSEELLAAINTIKATVTVEMLVEDIKDDKGEFAEIITGEDENGEEMTFYKGYMTMAMKAGAVIDEIGQEIVNVGTPVEEARTQAIADWNEFVTNQLKQVMDEAFKAELSADAEAPAIGDLMDCENATQVSAKLREKKDAYATWLAGKLAAKTYTVTLNDVKIDGLTVKYGEFLEYDAIYKIDPAANMPDKMIDPEDHDLYNEDGSRYEFGDPVYGNVVIHYNLVDAITISPEADKKNFDYSAIPVKADKAELLQADFTGANSFITRLGTEGDNLVTYRTSNKCIENKDGGLQLTLESYGKITIKFASTGGSNVSRIGLKDSYGGSWIPADTLGKGISLVERADEYTYTDKETSQEITPNVPEEIGTYKTTGTTAVEITFLVPAGTYTIYCPSAAVQRGARIMGITQEYLSYKVKKVDVESVKITGYENTNLDLEANLYLYAEVLPYDANDQNVVWASSDESVATVDQNGIVTAVAGGYVTITATAGGVSGEVTLDVDNFGDYVTEKINLVQNYDSTDILEQNGETFAAVIAQALDGLERATNKVAVDKIVADFEAEAEKLKSVVYNVTLHYGDTEVDTTITVSQGQTLAEPTDTKYAQAKPGYKLTGWYTDSILENAYTFGSEVTDAVELWAKYEEVTITLKADVNDEAAIEGLTAEVVDGKIQKPETDPTKEGYNFLYWSLAGETTEYAFNADVIYDDVILVAQWQALIEKSDITFGTGYVGDDNSKLNVTDTKSLLTISSSSKFTDHTVDSTIIGDTTTTNALLSGGKVCSLKAGGKDIVVTLYVANTDSKFAGKKNTFTWTNTYDNADETASTYTADGTTNAQAITVKIKANSTVEISVDSGRLVLFGAHIETL